MLPPRGSRLLPTLVDHYATDNVSRVPWATIPIDNTDLSQGFKDITYSQLANAVNHAAGWLLKNLPAATTEFETIAYVGPKDIRYPILTLAVAKLGRKVSALVLALLMLILWMLWKLTWYRYYSPRRSLHLQHRHISLRFQKSKLSYMVEPLDPSSKAFSPKYQPSNLSQSKSQNCPSGSAIK
jgi:hypothetical protein